MIPGGPKLLFLAGLCLSILFSSALFAAEPELPLPPLADVQHQEAKGTEGWSLRGSYRANRSATVRAFVKTFERAGYRCELKLELEGSSILRWRSEGEASRSWLLMLTDNPKASDTLFQLGEEPGPNASPNPDADSTSP